MSQYRETPEGMIDYDFYKKAAGRLRCEARNRCISAVIHLICVPFGQLTKFARRWQAVWPSPPVTGGLRMGFSLGRAGSLFWQRVGRPH